MRIAAVLVLLVAASGCAHLGLGSDRWVRLQSRHFRLYVPDGTKDAAEILRALEVVHAALSSSFFKEVDLGRVDVLVVGERTNRAIFDAATTAAFVARVPGAQGDDLGANGLIVTQTEGRPERRVEAVASLFATRALPRSPFWFKVGFARYARSLSYTNEAGRRIACFGQVVEPPVPIRFVERALAAEWDDYGGNDEDRLRDAAWMIVDAILHGAAGRNITRLPSTLATLRDGAPTDAVLRAAFTPEVISAFETSIRDHAVAYERYAIADGRALCPLGFPVPKTRAPDLGPWTREKVDASAGDTALQRLRKLPHGKGYAGWYP